MEEEDEKKEKREKEAQLRKKAKLEHKLLLRVASALTFVSLTLEPVVGSSPLPRNKGQV